MPDVTVLGAGIVGLSTALRILQEIPSARVLVVADRFTTETTSDGAAGSFRPTLKLTGTTSLDVFRKWCTDSFRWYHELNTDHDPAETGVLRFSGYQFSDDKEYPFHHSIVYNFRELTQRELTSYPGGWKYGWFYTTLITESRRYLPWLMERIEERGGRIVRKTISNLNELVGTCDILVNCSGIGSRRLFSDDQVYPVRGHLIRVQAPWIKHFYVFDNGNSYIYPGQDNVTIGGTRQRDEWDTTVTSEWFEDIMKRCCRVLPALKNCWVERRWVGLRPHRSEVRVEAETVNVGGKQLQVVHNYGHGANGIALSWGTAVHACAIVKDALARQKEGKARL